MLQNIPRHTLDEARELRGLFEKQLRELLWVENTATLMLSDIINDVFSGDLEALLQDYRIKSTAHITRIEKIFSLIGLASAMIPYKAIECFIAEAAEVSSGIKQGVVRDAALIAVLQKIKHYEIASYGTMRTYAIALKEEEVIILLEETLTEEKEADLALSYIAESHINTEAADKEI